MLHRLKTAPCALRSWVWRCFVESNFTLSSFVSPLLAPTQLFSSGLLGIADTAAAQNLIFDTSQGKALHSDSLILSSYWITSPRPNFSRLCWASFEKPCSQPTGLLTQERCVMGVWYHTILSVLGNMYWLILAEHGDESGAKRVQNN